jgi:diguanylate cyclase (GGDEF)-like protein
MDSPATANNAANNGNHLRILRLDYFLHPSFYDDPDLLRRARILVATICVVIGMAVIGIVFLAAAPVPTITRIIGIPIEFIIFVFMALLLRKLKHDAAYTLCSQMAVGFMLVIVAFATFVTGGISTSPVAQLLVAPPLMAFFFGGIRAGNSCALIVGLLIASALLLEKNGVSFPQTIEAKDADNTNSMIMLMGFCAISALAFIYERASTVLRSERDKEHQKVIQLAQTDPLTGLANRRMFDDMLTTHIAQLHTNPMSRSLALCYLDLDGFKLINDHHGHDVGDQVLRAVSIRLRSSLRGVDLIGRHGGDEFMLLLDQLEPGPAVEVMALRFLQIIGQPIETSSGLLSVGGSLGFAFFPQHGANTEALKRSADSAMYSAKRNQLGWSVFAAEQTSHPSAD